MTYILGIETSCDETAASVLAVGSSGCPKIMSNIVFSQIKIHQKYSGVVPEIAAREHVARIIPVLDAAIREAKITKNKLAALAITSGPGLITSLLSGVETVRTLAFAWQKPVVAVNHIAGHLAAAFIERKKKVKFPALALTVSGGHTDLVLLADYDRYQIIGRTLDDAAGEAFDKGAKMLGLGYPGGPAIAKMAAKYSSSSRKNIGLELPRPMLHSANYDFSFSGLKTALWYKIKKDSEYQKHLPEYCHQFQAAIIDVLLAKTIKAAKDHQVRTIILCGGVSANTELRQALAGKLKTELPQVEFLLPLLKYTTDNAAMIALAGYYLYRRRKFTTWKKLRAQSVSELA